MLRSSPAGDSHRCETHALPPSTHAPCSAALSPERGCAVCKSHIAVISLALLQPLVLVGLPPHTPPGYAANHTSRLFRLRSCNRSCSWGYRPTPRRSTRQTTDPTHHPESVGQMPSLLLRNRQGGCLQSGGACACGRGRVPSRSCSLRSQSDYGTRPLAGWDFSPPPSGRNPTLHRSTRNLLAALSPLPGCYAPHSRL